MRKYRSVKMRAFCQFFFCNFLFCSRYCFYFFFVATLVPQYLYNFYNLRSVSPFMAGRVIIRTVPCKERTLSLFNSLNKKIPSGCGFTTFPHTVLHSRNEIWISGLSFHLRYCSKQLLPQIPVLRKFRGLCSLFSRNKYKQEYNGNNLNKNLARDKHMNTTSMKLGANAVQWTKAHKGSGDKESM